MPHLAGDPVTLAAQATFALAVIAVLGLLLSAVGVIVAGRQAKATQQSVAQNSLAIELQREELKVLQHQVDVVERQVADARRDRDEERQAASPWLRVQATQLGTDEIIGTVAYAHGSTLATDVEIWIRFHETFYVSKLDFVAPGEVNRSFAAHRFSTESLQDKPLPDFHDQLGQTDYWIGAIWRSPVGLSRIYCGKMINGAFERTQPDPMQARW